MILRSRSLRTKGLVILLLLIALTLVSSSQNQTANAECWNCVHLDPGSAITWGCDPVQNGGSTYCWPDDYGCNIGGGYCHMVDGSYCVGNPWDQDCQELCWDEPWHAWCTDAE